MDVVFQSTIKNRGTNPHDWYIELKDMVDGRVEICQDMEEFERKIEELGADYGGHIDKVEWLQDEAVTDEQYSEINAQMRIYQEKLNNDSND